MKKIILTLLLGCITIVLHAQEKGFYLTLAGSLGGNYFNYKMDGDNCSSPKLGWGGALGVQYFFTKNWGIATGVGLTFYNTQGRFSTSWEKDPAHYSFGNMQDNSGKTGENMYTMMVGLDDWKEVQQAYFIEIPLLLMYQTKWGKKEKVGMYFGIGAKAQIPVLDATYEVSDNSNLEVLGYYDNTTMQFFLGTPYSLPEQGLGVTNKTGYKGDLELKTSFAGTAELGLLFSLSRRVDLSLGGYFDYGFINVKKNETTDIDLVKPTTQLTPAREEMYVGKNINYNGYMNSYVVDKANTIAYGVKLGLRLKLGKLANRKIEEDTTSVIPEKPKKNDTVFVIHQYPPIDTNLYRPLIRAVEELAPDGKGKREQPTESELRILFEPIFFDLDKSKLLPASIIILNRKAAILERYPRMQLLITGNTCDLASDIYNLKLGERRANAAKVYLETLGAGKNRISVVSQSFHHPMMPNVDETNREKNRRCDFYPTGY